MGPKHLNALRGTPPSVPLFDTARLVVGARTDSETEKPAMTAIVPDGFVPGLRAETAEICIALPATSQTNATYRIVVFNPEAGWAGVGFLPRGYLTIVY